jgi:hypothetical protein
LAQGLDFDAALDELYGVELGDFVARRDALAKELRADGRAEAAALMTAQRKPTVPAWIVNQLARRNRREVDLLLDAGHRAREEQRKAVAGKRANLDAALEQEREALRALLAAAREVAPDANAGTLERVSRTLRAAAVTEEGRELIARGRLERELDPPGFEVLS